MPRTVTYYDTAEVIAMLEADHRREFRASSSGVLYSAIAYFDDGPMVKCALYTSPLSRYLMIRDDWQLTKGKP